MNQSIHQSINTWVIPKVSALDILDNSIFHNLYISETYSFTDAVNCLYLMLCAFIDYNDVISAADTYEAVKNVRFTDV